MRLSRTLTLALAAAALAVPVAAGIKAMTLKELMASTHDVAQVHVVGKTSFSHVDAELGRQVWTSMAIVGTSLRTGKPVQTEVVFLGSHDPADGYGTSEMPTLQDTRVGNEIVLFMTSHEEILDGAPMVHHLGEVFRLEQAFGEAVLIGKGQGTAFPINVKLSEARALVTQAHAELLAEQTTEPAQAK